jgi:hypothetical protein
MHNHFLELRQRLADAKAALRTARATFEAVRAEQEQRVKDEANGDIGKNEKDRERFLILALRTNPIYQNTLTNLRQAEHEVERVEALLEAAIDERRAAEWQIRACLADGLFRAGVQSDDSDPVGDSAFDDAADAMADAMLDDGMSHGNLNSTHYAGSPRPRPTYSMLEADIPL